MAKTWTIAQLAAMPWKDWQALYMEDLAVISGILNLNWDEVKESNQYFKKKYKQLPSKVKIAAFLRKQVLNKA